MTLELLHFGSTPWPVGNYGASSFEIQGEIDGHCVALAVVKSEATVRLQDKSDVKVPIPHALQVAHFMAAAPALYAALLNPDDAELRDRALAAARGEHVEAEYKSFTESRA